MNDNNNINIGPSALDFLNDKKKTLIEAIEKLNKELVNIELAINAVSGLEKPITSKSIQPNNIQPVNWKELIVNLLLSEQRLLKTRDIAILLHPNLSNDELKKVIVQIANALNYISKRPSPQIRRYVQKEPEIFYYGLPSWFEEDNSVKSEYLNKINKAA